jgi:phage terminase small subunit
MADKPLTPKQEKYVQGLFAGLLSQREAYRVAYPSSIKWKDNVVDVKACQAAAIGKIKLRVKELQDEYKLANMETIDKIMAEYQKIGHADIKDFLSFRTAQTVVDHDKITGEPIIDYAQIIDMKDSDEVDGSLISEVSINSRGVFSFKLHDKMKALEKMGSHLGMFKETIDVNIKKKLEDFL